MKRIVLAVIFLLAPVLCMAEAGQAIEAGFGELLDCDSNRLYSSTEH